MRLRVCSCALHCDDLRSLRKNFNHLCSSLALVMQQLVYTAYAVIYPPRQWKMWILRCDRWTILLLVWLVAVVFRYFFHINVLMYIAQIVRELIAGPGGIKNPSLKESEAWHLWRRTLLSGLALPPHVLQRVGKEVTKFIVERAHTHTQRLSHTRKQSIALTVRQSSGHWWNNLITHTSQSGITLLQRSVFQSLHFDDLIMILLRIQLIFFSLQTLDSFSGLRCNYVQVLSCCLWI